MTNKISYAISLLTIAFIFSCNKDKDEPNDSPINLSFKVQDSLIFEHSGKKNLNIEVSSNSNKTFMARIENANNAFKISTNPINIPSNENRFFEIEFKQKDVVPNAYACNLSVTIPNENFVPKTKTIYFVFNPNCAYNFRNHKNGEITFQINGLQQNKAITCSYNESGQLVVKNLTTYDVVLNFNCENNQVEMQPLTNIGSYMTANGSVSGNEINLQMFSDGNLHAIAKIKP
jgi:hypothetical protein